MSLRRNKFPAYLVGAVGLLLTILLTPRCATVYAQEDESFTVTPSATDDEADAAWEPTPDVSSDADPGPVLDLPQVVAIGRDGASAESTDSSDTVASDDQSDDLVDYAAQGAVSNEPPRSSVPTFAPETALAPVSTVRSYLVVRGGCGVPAWFGVGMTRPLTPGPFLPTSPMLSAPRGSRVIMGGWWHRAR